MQTNEGKVLVAVVGDELYCLPGGSRIYGEWAANIHDGSTPGGKSITRCITPDPATVTYYLLNLISNLI